MSQPSVTQHVAMSLDQYLALPDELRAEYVDGRAIVNPPPSFIHQKICQRLVAQLAAIVRPPHDVVGGAGWQVSREHVRIPDVMVLSAPPEGTLVTETPLVCMEVLSSNRNDDLVRKSTEYLEAGVLQYWVVDPRDRVIDVYANHGGWHTLAHLTVEKPSATVELPAGAGSVGLNLDEVLGEESGQGGGTA